MTTERLQEFMVLAQTLNYSKAANTLFMTQSVLSKHISEMEQDIGVKLFNRNTHRVTLTIEGHILLRSLPGLLKKTDLAESLLSNDNKQTDGYLKIKYQEQCLCSPVMSFIRDFKQKYTNITLKMSVVPSASSIDVIDDADVLLSPCDFIDKVQGRFDCALIFSQYALLAIPPYHHFGDRHEISLDELGGENLIVPFADELFGPYARTAFLTSRKCHEKIQKIPVESPLDGIVKVELGDGVMIIPHTLKSRLYPHTRTLRIVDDECTFPVYIYKKKNSSDKSAELFFNSMNYHAPHNKKLSIPDF